MYDSLTKWTSLYAASEEIAFPAEGVIRILKGNFPTLRMPRPQAGAKIIDVGCGDGRHLPLFHSLGMKSAGVEITDEIVNVLTARMQKLEIPCDIRTGTCGNIPFPSEEFDFLLTWNSCYYMSLGRYNFSDHVEELARVVKPGGWIIASVPKRTNFIYSGSSELKPGYVSIRDDYFGGLRDGEVMRQFAGALELEQEFAPKFSDFCHAEIDMNWFGLAYSWHVFVAQRSAD